ncbi:MAG: ABC transporter permease, partial [Tabrizicola sp.]
MSLSHEDKPLVIAAGFTLVILLIGTAYTLSTNGTAPLLQPTYLLQQLQIGSFLGICAAGLMLVILTGHIDLSIPSTLTGAAMIGTAIGGPWAIPAALAFGLVVGLINGAGTAVLRVPSMIFTLGMDTVLRGVTVAQTGGFAPQDQATRLMLALAKDRFLGIPVALYVWAAVSVLIAFLLARTAFGRALYAIGTRE